MSVAARLGRAHFVAQWAGALCTATDLPRSGDMVTWYVFPGAHFTMADDSFRSELGAILAAVLIPATGSTPGGPRAKLWSACLCGQGGESMQVGDTAIDWKCGSVGHHTD